MDPKELGRQPAAPFAAIAATVQLMPTQHAGWTKREEAAVAAMAGYAAVGSAVGGPLAPESVAKYAIQAADALLAELSRDSDAS